MLLFIYLEISDTEGREYCVYKAYCISAYCFILNIFHYEKYEGNSISKLQIQVATYVF